MREEYIYTTVPDEAFDTEPEFNKRREIMLFLKAYKGQFFTAGKIAKAVGLPTRGTQVEVRKAITQLLELDGEPVISTSKGFGLAISKEQLLNYADRLENRLKGLQRRIDCVRDIANNKKTKIKQEINVKVEDPEWF